MLHTSTRIHLFSVQKILLPIFSRNQKFTGYLSVRIESVLTRTNLLNTPYIYPAILRLLYGCGTRIGETVRLKIEDVNLSDGIITLHNSKNNVSRMLPLSDSLTTYLRKYDSRVDRSGNAYFFPALHGECLFSCYNT